jgi:hypothetical protein
MNALMTTAAMRIPVESPGVVGALVPAAGSIAEIA